MACLRPETVDAMRAAVERRIADSTTGDGLRVAFQLLRDDARRANLSADQLLRTLKSLWEGAPAMQRLPAPARQQHVAELAALCLAQYYAQD